MDLKKEEVKKVSIWIQLPNLDLKYWGRGECLMKLTAGIGNFIKFSQATFNSDRLIFARIMIEVAMNQSFPDAVWFENEKGVNIAQEVMYEWKIGNLKNVTIVWVFGMMMKSIVGGKPNINK